LFRLNYRHTPREGFPTMRTVILFAALAACLSIGACNTVAGAGRDVSSAGHAVTDTADDAKPH
jgi:predicted small secreted protein